MRILLADIAILIALERGGLVKALGRLTQEFSITDVQFESQLSSGPGAVFLDGGITVVELGDADTHGAFELAKRHRSIAFAEACALFYATAHACTLLCLDPHLARLAEADGLPCKGLLWLIDELHRESAMPRAALRDALDIIASHPRSVLPMKDVQQRLRRFEREEPAHDELEEP